jgi:hypothetical protein
MNIAENMVSNKGYEVETALEADLRDQYGGDQISGFTDTDKDVNLGEDYVDIDINTDDGINGIDVIVDEYVINDGNIEIIEDLSSLDSGLSFDESDIDVRAVSTDESDIDVRAVSTDESDIYVRAESTDESDIDARAVSTDESDIDVHAVSTDIETINNMNDDIDINSENANYVDIKNTDNDKTYDNNEIDSIHENKINYKTILSKVDKEASPSSFTSPYQLLSLTFISSILLFCISLIIVIKNRNNKNINAYIHKNAQYSDNKYDNHNIDNNIIHNNANNDYKNDNVNNHDADNVVDENEILEDDLVDIISPIKIAKKSKKITKKIIEKISEPPVLRMSTRSRK